MLLSIIMVGQSVQSTASDARAAKEFTDTETILDRLDAHTAGGISDVLDAIRALAPPSSPTTTSPASTSSAPTSSPHGPAQDPSVG